LRAGRAEVEQIPANQLAQLRVRPADGAAADSEHALHAIVVQALTQDALSHHSGGAEKDHLHDVSSSSARHSPRAVGARMIMNHFYGVINAATSGIWPQSDSSARVHARTLCK